MESSGGHYEFTPAQNEVLATASRWVGLFAWIMILSAVIMTLGGILGADETSIGAYIAAAVYVTIGINFRGSAAAMKKVVSTEGNDISHLMTGIDDLASAFQVMGILILIGVTMVAASLIVLGSIYAPGP
jgi:hypothetical protein